MGKVINTMDLVEKARKTINPNYEMYVNNLITVIDSSKDKYDMVHNGFLFGYMQGRKAAIAEMKQK